MPEEAEGKHESLEPNLDRGGVLLSHITVLPDKLNPGDACSTMLMNRLAKVGVTHVLDV